MIHDDHPFVPPPSHRDPARRFRGRLAAPVTILTAGSGKDRTGLTVSSLIVVEGEAPWLVSVISPTTDLWDRIADTGRFVVHVCATPDRSLADVFAGIRPSPGGPFTGLDVEQTEWGPAIARLPHRASCTVETVRELGWSGVVEATIDLIEVGELADPLVYFRGSYRSLEGGG